MQFIRGLHNLRLQKEACIATIGNFDGVHLGHHAVLDQVKDSAKSNGLISTVVIFEPQPIEYFAPNKAPSRLTRLREKLQQFAIHDIDRVVCLRFDEKTANLSAADFVDHVLLDGLAVKKLIIGDDFRFAKNREGDYQYLVNAAEEKDFDVTKTNSFTLDSERVSSTLIRESLADGDMIKAARLLGRPYRISGRVAHGDKRGRRLGFPTANVELHRYFSPVEGIFSGRIFGVDETPLDAVIYVGSRPVFKGQRVILEVHIMDFDEDIYGEYISVEFIKSLRKEIKFETIEDLKNQLYKDREDALKVLK